MALFKGRDEGIYLTGWVWVLKRETRMTPRLFSGLSNCEDVVAITTRFKSSKFGKEKPKAE